MFPEQRALSAKEADELARASGSGGQKNEEACFRALIDEALTAEDWKKVFRRLVRSKSIRAAEILLNYRFGRAGKAGAPSSSKNTWIPLSDVVQLPPIGGDSSSPFEESYDALGAHHDP